MIRPGCVEKVFHFKCAQYWEDEINGVHKPGRNLEIMTVKYEVFPEYDLRTFRVVSRLLCYVSV